MSIIEQVLEPRATLIVAAGKKSSREQPRRTARSTEPLFRKSFAGECRHGRGC